MKCRVCIWASVQSWSPEQHCPSATDPANPSHDVCEYDSTEPNLLCRPTVCTVYTMWYRRVQSYIVTLLLQAPLYPRTPWRSINAASIIMRPSSLGGAAYCVALCLSVCPSVPLSWPSVTSRHLANYNDTHVLCGTRRGPHIVRPSRPLKLVIIILTRGRDCNCIGVWVC